ncbi:MAG: GAF domain-containing sensor histidine kinase, partial [Polyangiales bacterium]
GFAGTIAAEQRPSLLPSVDTEPLIPAEASLLSGMRGLYGAPLVESGRVIGVAHIGSRAATDFSDQDKRLFVAMANRATSAITQHLLRDAAMARAAELAEAMAQVKQLEQEREDFIGTVVHDLRNPLTAVRSLAQLTARTLDRKGDPGNAERVRRLDGQVERMNRLLGDLMDLTLAARGRLPVQLETFDYGHHLAEVLAEWEAASPRHRLVASIEPPVIEVTADPDRVSQVLNNLVSNALKYSPNGGDVTVIARCIDGMVETTVRDHGIGMTQEDQEKLFTPYARASTSATARIRGHGLGLFVVRELVHAQRGTLWVESSVGSGSTFHFTLPLAGGADPQDR